MTTKTKLIRCESSAVFQQRCETPAFTASEAHHVEWVRPQDRGTAKAAGTTRGLWEHLTVCGACADAMLDKGESDAEWFRAAKKGS